MSPRFPINESAYSSVAYIEFLCYKLAPHSIFSEYTYFANLGIGQFTHCMFHSLLFLKSKIAMSVSNIFALSGVLKVGNSIIGSFPIQMINLLFTRTFSKEFVRYQSVNQETSLFSVINNSYSLVANDAIPLNYLPITFARICFNSSETANGILSVSSLYRFPNFFHRPTSIAIVWPIVQVAV